MKKMIVGLSLLCAVSMAWALPSLQEVETETRAGHYAEAENMMAQVIAAKPESAKAHYVYAELLAHNANFSKAASEAGKARELDPKIGFTDPDKFRSFEQTLQREQNPAPRQRVSERPTSGSLAAPAVQSESVGRPGIPGWIWIGGLILLAIVAWRMIGRSSPRVSNSLATAGGQGGYGAAGYGPGGPAGPAGSPGYGPGGVAPGYGQGVAPAGRGGGLLGTGLAVAGGVAGGMALDELLHHRGENGAANNIGGFQPGGYQPSGIDPAAQELESRPVDFGNGGDWDSGGGGSIDTGGDSGGGGGWD